LALLDFTQPFVIECDACRISIGAVLSQNNRLIAYFSEAFKGFALTLSTYEKEMLAIVKSIKKWRPYLLGKPFTVRTDQQSLKYLLEQRITTPAQTRWLPKIMGYEYIIEYKKGVDNQVTDSLSRVTENKVSNICWSSALLHRLRTRWLPKIMGYEYIIEYKKGVDNQTVDSLSRVT